MTPKEFQQSWINFLNSSKLDECERIVKESEIDLKPYRNDREQVFVYVSFVTWQKIKNEKAIDNKLCETAKVVAFGHLFFDQNDSLPVNFCIKKIGSPNDDF